MLPAVATDPGPRIETHDPGHRRVERVMGAVVSLLLPDGGADSETADAAFRWLHDVDRRFSPFRADSEVSRMMRSEVNRADISCDLAEVLEIAEIVELLSDGAFDIRGHRTDGAPDPTAVVKGWAVDRAADILVRSGLERFCVSAGGDVLARGGSPSTPWRIGVTHPHDRSSVALVLEADDLAAATSGITERGQHSIDARSARPVDELLTLTVAGPSLARADAHATARVRDGLRRTPLVRVAAGLRSVRHHPSRTADHDTRPGPVSAAASRGCWHRQRGVAVAGVAAPHPRR